MIQPATPAPVVKENTRIIFILDRSGSMNSVLNDTIGGYNTYVAEQKDDAGKVRFSLIQFDDRYEVHHSNVDINDVPLLTTETFRPRGGTALFDAIGRTIAEALDNEDPAEQTIVTILTDGEENRSSDWNYSSLQTQIKKAQDERGWQVIFIGAGLSAKNVAATMGIKAMNAFSYGDAHGNATAKGMNDAFSSASLGSTMYRAASRGVDMTEFNNAVFAGAAAAAAGDVNMDVVYSTVATDTSLKARLKSFKDTKKTEVNKK